MLRHLLLKWVLLLPLTGWGQHEMIYPMRSNPVIKQRLLTDPVSANRTTSGTVNFLDLPVIDDFSASIVFPDSAIWTDRGVYINNNFARNPLTVGVATFDGIGADGDPYNNLSAVIQGSCDTLTSKPINLLTRPSSAGGGQYQVSDSITLRFFYQKKGWGDAPESGDSLVVEFFDPDPLVNRWSRQWFARGPVTAGQDTAFIPVIIRFTTSTFLKDGFRFRFRSHGAKTGSLDHWHVDYVKLYRAYNPAIGQADTLFDDVAMTHPPGNLLNEYTSIPWDHFLSLNSTQQQDLIRDDGDMNYRVNGPQPADVGFNNRIYDSNGGYVTGFGANNGNIFPSRPNNQPLVYTYPVTGLFPATPSISPDSNSFIVKNFFTNGNAFPGLKTNDTVTYRQEFYNYYSLDDGSAEGGYDLIGASTGRVAMKFDILKPDTLRAVRFFFSQYGDSVSNYLFTIKIWSSLNPENLIYQESNQRTAYVDEVNGYATYVLDQIVPVNGTIYIGFQHQQVYPNGIHLGYDKNTASNSRMFYNIGSGWTQSAITPGTFMIRPVMGDTSLFAGLNDAIVDKNPVRFFPNPASISINIEDASGLVREIEVLSMEGRLMARYPYQPSIDISQFQPGLYYLGFLSKDSILSRQKFIISR